MPPSKCCANFLHRWHISKQGQKEEMFFVLDKSHMSQCNIVDLTTSSLDCTHTSETSNVTKHMPTQFQL